MISKTLNENVFLLQVEVLGRFWLINDTTFLCISGIVNEFFQYVQKYFQYVYIPI